MIQVQSLSGVEYIALRGRLMGLLSRIGKPLRPLFEDIFQETLVTVLETYDDTPIEELLFFDIARKMLLRKAREVRRLKNALNSAKQDPSSPWAATCDAPIEIPSDEGAILNLEQLSDTFTAVARICKSLTPRELTVFLTVVEQEGDCTKAAHILGRNVKTVRKQWKIATRKVLRHLKCDQPNLVEALL
jgi:DNA-directed RNA polymerase specialized sigma24 family protein